MPRSAQASTLHVQVELRILVSAANGGALFNLRAQLRERLVAWLVNLEDGRYLPRTRVDEKAEPAAPGAPVPHPKE